MIEKVKLGIWDYLVYLMTGTCVLLLVLMHCILKEVLTLEKILGIPAAGLVTILVFSLLLSGMIVEPMANLVFKLFTTRMKHWRKEIGFKDWDEGIDTMEQTSKTFIPDAIHGSCYQFAKNWVIKNGDPADFYAFLSKYGFYRSLSFVFAVNVIPSGIMYWNLGGIIGASVSILLMLLFFNRASVFYRHMSVNIYTQFISGNKV